LFKETSSLNLLLMSITYVSITLLPFICRHCSVINSIHFIDGGDEFAQKAASNELRAMNALGSCNISHLHSALSALIFYRGHCVIAVAHLPIDNTTIVSGSPDGGRTWFDSSPHMQQMFADAGQRLNLCAHHVGAPIPNGSSSKRMITHVAGDVEGHQGRDGRFYAIDLARLLPPTPPLRGLVNSQLYHQFRPEFMRYPFFPSCSRP
jgi:hypothetical protein